MGQRWKISDERTLDAFCRHARVKLEAGKPVTVEFMAQRDAKSTQQVRYMHSLCAALADFHRVALEEAKADAKASFGVVEVSSSHVDGSRRVRLKSFGDYTRQEASTFCNAMQVHLDEAGIPYTPAQMPAV